MRGSPKSRLDVEFSPLLLQQCRVQGGTAIGNLPTITKTILFLILDDWQFPLLTPTVSTTSI
jgi:hypothetical protein